MSYVPSSENGTGQQEEAVPKPKRPKLQKPPTFKQVETAAKKILEAQGINYYDWIHEKHEALVNEVLLQNVDSIGLLVSKK